MKKDIASKVYGWLQDENNDHQIGFKDDFRKRLLRETWTLFVDNNMFWIVKRALFKNMVIDSELDLMNETDSKGRKTFNIINFADLSYQDSTTETNFEQVFKRIQFIDQSL